MFFSTKKSGSRFSLQGANRRQGSTANTFSISDDVDRELSTRSVKVVAAADPPPRIPSFGSGSDTSASYSYSYSSSSSSSGSPNSSKSFDEPLGAQQANGLPAPAVASPPTSPTSASFANGNGHSGHQGHNRSATTSTGMSEWSSPIVPNGRWCSQNFLTGAGMVLFQRGTRKIVIVYDSQNKYWFLPRGRKDIGETIEECALREAYEESGYRAAFLPLKIPTHAPAPPHDKDAKRKANTEPIFMQMTSWGSVPGMPVNGNAGEYLTFWYVGVIAENAVREENTGMANERHFVSHLVTVDEALEKLRPIAEDGIVDYAWKVYLRTLESHSPSKTSFD